MDASLSPRPECVRDPRRRSGIALVLCAPSGTGKSTLTKRLLHEFSCFSFSVSCTTRAPRDGEVDGRDYRFLSIEEFKKLRNDGFFAEWAEVHGNFYGTPLQAAQDTLDSGSDLLFDIDVQGARQLKASLPGALFVFVLPPSRAALEKRLRGRGSESEASLAKRLANAKTELADATWFDYWIVNDNFEEAYADLAAVFRAATLAPSRRPSLVDTLLAEWL